MKQAMCNPSARRISIRSSAAVAALAFTMLSGMGTAAAQDNVGQPAGEAGKPNPLKNVYFGEQHLHTSASPDAF